ncbi:MAG: hypothetical protein HC945_00960 [Nitrosarchaeum sp.]|nr:hypothetical protein [Nitrosarchaeum sp.]
MSVLYREEIERIASDHVFLDSRAQVFCKTFVWCRFAPARLLERSGLKGCEGYVYVDGHLRCVGEDAVFAAGSCARPEMLADVQPEPLACMRQGVLAARNILAIQKGKSLRLWRPKGHVARGVPFG